ncbi:MAG: DUF4422 domain-containing protein [Christensenellales bacterium]
MNVKIFISCHKKFKSLNNEIFVPIQVGTEINKKIEGMVHDNDLPDNISQKNKKYCELTAHYFAWKNVDADYYGFFHYRRYLSFSKEKFKANSENHVVVNDLNEESIKKYGLDEENVKNVVSDYDVLVPEKRVSVDIARAYGLATTQARDEIEFCFDYVYNKYPQMRKAIKKYKHAFYGYFYNMFIMKKEIFKHYANWLFDILKAHEENFNVEHYDVQSYRVSGYLAERLTGLYITWLQLKGDVKIKELQTLMLKNVEINEEPKDVCNIVVPCNNKTFLQTNVLINSIISNCDKEHNYLISVVEDKLTAHHKHLLQKYSKSNAKIVFKNKKYFDEKSLSKYIYLNNNCVVDFDLYTLFKSETNSRVNGSYDLAKIIKFGKTKLQKQIKKLQKYNPYNCINKDVLLVDNKKADGNSTIDLSWNVQVNQKRNLLGKAYSFASHSVYNEYAKAIKNAKIITYYGKINPLNNPTCELGDVFWKYAKSSNVYELLILNLFAKYKKIRTSVYEKLFPTGSMRRLAIKTYLTKY